MTTEVRITPGYDIKGLLDRADGPVVWAGKGAERLGLTGAGTGRDDLIRVFSGEHLEDEDENEPPVSLPEQPRPVSLLDQMRLDGTL